MKFNVNVKTKFKSENVLDKLHKILEKIMYLMEAESVRLCPVNTGRLRNSIHVDKINEDKWIMADGVFYGVYVEYGTSPHLITPVRKKALKFKVSNKVVYTKKVRHPGTNAQPFFRPALSYGKQKLREMKL